MNQKLISHKTTIYNFCIQANEIVDDPLESRCCSELSPARNLSVYQIRGKESLSVSDKGQTISQCIRYGARNRSVYQIRDKQSLIVSGMGEGISQCSRYGTKNLAAYQIWGTESFSVSDI